MKLSTRGRYALRFMVTLAKEGGQDAPVTLESICHKTGMSKKYLEQIAIPLKKAGVLRGVAGRKGGYLLGRKKEEISLGSIVQAAIGPLSIVDCVEDPEGCEKSGSCETRLIYQLINAGIRQVLCGHSLADLADSRRLEEVIRQLAVQEVPRC